MNISNLCIWKLLMSLEIYHCSFVSNLLPLVLFFKLFKFRKIFFQSYLYANLKKIFSADLQDIFFWKLFASRIWQLKKRKFSCLKFKFCLTFALGIQPANFLRIILFNTVNLHIFPRTFHCLHLIFYVINFCRTN